MFRIFKSNGGALRAYLHTNELWTGIFVWLVIAGLCVLVANVLAATL
jgi:hypothetical protein